MPHCPGIRHHGDLVQKRDISRNQGGSETGREKFLWGVGCAYGSVPSTRDCPKTGLRENGGVLRISGKKVFRKTSLATVGWGALASRTSERVSETKKQALLDRTPVLSSLFTGFESAGTYLEIR